MLVLSRKINESIVIGGPPPENTPQPIAGSGLAIETAREESTDGPETATSTVTVTATALETIAPNFNEFISGLRKSLAVLVCHRLGQSSKDPDVQDLVQQIIAEWLAEADLPVSRAGDHGTLPDLDNITRITNRVLDRFRTRRRQESRPLRRRLAVKHPWIREAPQKAKLCQEEFWDALIDGTPEDITARLDIQEALQSLTDSERRLVYLRCWDGLDLVEIAANSDVLEVTVRVQFHRICRKLREWFAARSGGDDCSPGNSHESEVSR